MKGCLYKDSTETDSQYDYFSVADNLEITNYNGGGTSSMLVDHDIPNDTDSIEDWSPSDQSVSNSSQVQVSIPWGLSWTFSPNGSYSIDEIGSQTYDYGRWELTPSLFSSFLPNPARFKPGTSWLSAAANHKAHLDIRHEGEYEESSTLPHTTTNTLYAVTWTY